MCFYGQVVDESGKGIPNALVQIWEPDETGNYDLQLHDPSEMDLRGCFHCDSEGRYYFRGLCPTGYMIPMDGPVGDMIRAQHRHGFRPAHIHFVIGAPGYRELVTALYIAGDAHIESDTVFGVNQSLIVTVNKKDDNVAATASRQPALRLQTGRRQRQNVRPRRRRPSPNHRQIRALGFKWHRHSCLCSDDLRAGHKHGHARCNC